MVQAEKIDGRKARGLRTRDAIVTALMDLVNGGEISPTAQQIAVRAGVSVRSVYQHFTDIEGLYADAAARTFDWVLSVTSEIDPGWPLARRIEEFANAQATALEALTPFSRASRLIEISSPTVRLYRATMQQWGLDRVARIFGAELDGVPEPVRDGVLAAVDVLTSADGWEHLRTTGASVEAARQAIQVGMTALLSGAGRRRVLTS